MNPDIAHQEHIPLFTELRAEDAAAERKPAPPLMTELLLLPNGEVLVHNLTPTFAELLTQLGMSQRTASEPSPEVHRSSHSSP